MRSSLKAVLGIGVVLAAVAGGAFAYYYFTAARSLPEGLIQANGRIEGDTITVASKVAGRITSIRVREGDWVKAGDILIELEDKTARAKYSQAKSAHDAARARVEAAAASLVVLKQEVPHKTAGAEAGVEVARAEFQKAVSNEEQARKDWERFQNLSKQGVVSVQTAEKHELAWKQTTGELSRARAAVERAVQSHKDALIGPDRIRSREVELTALEAAEREARGHLDEAQSALDDLTILCPAEGMITARFTDLGEVVNAGAPLYEIVDLDKLFLKVFVPEPEIGKLRLGLEAQVYTDSYPDKPFPAKVRYIASRAEFTPKEVQTQKERVKLVYAVKLYFKENPNHCLTPGMPADGLIRYREDTPWTRPRWQ